MFIRRFHACSLLALAFVATANAEAPPSQEDVFTQVAAQRIASELPDYKIIPTAILKLEGRHDNGDTTGQISLERMFAFCAKTPEKCDAAMDDFSKLVANAVTERNLPIEAGMVRLAVRPVPYVERMRAQMGASPVPVYARVLVPGVALVPVADLAKSVRFVGERDLPKLGVTEEQLFALGEKNLRAMQKPLAEVAPVPGKVAVGQITGEEYAASRLAFHDDWRALADKMHHQLLVMAPSPDLVLYTDGSKKANVEALRKQGQELVQKSTRPLSSAVLRWTQTGWDEVK
jgi:hypothetical protein